MGLLKAEWPQDAIHEPRHARADNSRAAASGVLALQQQAGNAAVAQWVARNGDRSGGGGRGGAVGDAPTQHPSPGGDQPAGPTDFRRDSTYVDNIDGHVHYDILTNRLQVHHASGRWVDLDYTQIIQDMSAGETRQPGTVTLAVPPTYRDERTGLLFPSYFNEDSAPNTVGAVRAIEAERPNRQGQMRDALIDVAVAAHGVAGGAIAGSAQSAVVRGRARRGEQVEAQQTNFRSVREAVASATGKVERRIDVLRRQIQAAVRNGDTELAQQLVAQARADAERIRSGTATVLEREMPQLSAARRNDLANQLEAAARQTQERTGIRVEFAPSPQGQTGGRRYQGGVERRRGEFDPRTYGGRRYR